MGMMRQLLMGGGTDEGGEVLLTATGSTVDYFSPTLEFSVGETYEISWVGNIAALWYERCFVLTSTRTTYIRVGNEYSAFEATIFDKTVYTASGFENLRSVRIRLKWESASSLNYTIWINGNSVKTGLLSVQADPLDRYGVDTGTLTIKKLS